MSSMKFVQAHRVLNVLPPDADRFGADGVTFGSSGPRGAVGGASPVTGIVDVRNYRHVTFLVVYGATSAADHTITLEGCDALYSPTIHTELAFEYHPAGDTVTGGLQAVERLGTRATATTSGILTITGDSNRIIPIEVDVAEAEAAYIKTNPTGTLAGLRLRVTETTDDPTDGCVLAILSEPRFMADGDDMPQGLANAT